MNHILRNLIVLPLAIAAVTEITPVVAAPIVRSLSQSIAQGLSGNGASVTVWAGAGTNIDFTRTGETISRTWLDDPHAVVVDFDAPPGKGASIVHLKRVTGIHFPNLPETKATLLTVITRSRYGKKTYLFEVRYGSRSPQYATLAIALDSQASGGLIIGGDQTANWSDVERGLQRAIAKQLISATSPVVLRVQNFLALTRNGMLLQPAAEQAQVSLAVVSKLAEMGMSTTTPSPQSQPFPQQPSLK